MVEMAVERLRRSEMASPGSSVKMMRKALEELPVDEVFLDLEDSVAPGQKLEARRNIVQILNEARPSEGKTVAVRINGVRTRYWFGDLVSVVEGAGDKIDCIMVPKVDEPAEVLAVEKALASLEENLGLDKRIALEAQIETARGLANVNEIARCSDRLEALIFGPGDYAASIGMRGMTIGAQAAGYPGHIWHYAMFQIRNASAAAGLQAIDGPYAVINDLKGFEESAKLARSMGYDGKWVIHPSQVELCNKIFTPTEEEISRAKLIIEEYQRAWAEGRGAIALEGEMIDAATLRIANRIIETAKRLNLI